MNGNIHVEAEHNELILSNNFGDKVIIPANKRAWVQKKIDEGCHECIDSLVRTLPSLSNYAKDGSIFPNETEPITLVTPSGRRIETDTDNELYRNYYNSKLIGTRNEDKSWNLTDEIYGNDKALAPVTIQTTHYPSSVKAQLDYIKSEGSESGNYAIINKKANRIYYFDKTNKELRNEPVVTGQNNVDQDYSISMRDWFNMPENSGKTHEDYFNYLGDYQSRVTPSGHFTIASLNDHITKNPASWTGKIFNVMKDVLSGDSIGTRNSDIEASRLRDYGAQNKLFTLKDDNGVFSSKAMHGTTNPVRTETFDNGQETTPDKRDLSNGCINVNGNSKCFDYLGKGSSVYILPEMSDDIVKKESNIIDKANMIKKAKSKIYSKMKEFGYKDDEEFLNFATTVYGKESAFGTNKLIPIQDKLPFFHSDGDFQINPDSFKKYLPENYSNTFDNGIKALHNFYDANISYGADKLYDIYNTGSAKKNSPWKKYFNSLHDRVSKVK